MYKFVPEHADHAQQLRLSVNGNRNLSSSRQGGF